jgi:hypothetical protein
MTGLSIGWVNGCVQSRRVVLLRLSTANSVKLVGLFVTALVGLYTIEDLWDKFGDLKMSYVRLSSRRHATSNLVIAGPSEALGCPHRLPDHPSIRYIHGSIQTALPHSKPLGSG